MGLVRWPGLSDQIIATNFLCGLIVYAGMLLLSSAMGL